MKLLASNEHEICGQWLVSNGAVAADEACHRIEWLITTALSFIDTGESGWERVYQDPRDSRFWLLSYPQSHLQGGGPPSLRAINSQEAASFRGASAHVGRISNAPYPCQCDGLRPEHNC